MATIDIRRVDRELKALLSLSQGVRKRVRKVLEAIERDPDSFEEIDPLGLDLAPHPGVSIRKAKIIQGKHDYRMIFLCRRQNDSEHVDLLYVFKRKDGYHIDWEWMASVLEE
jgi:hypothetical protein